MSKVKIVIAFIFLINIYAFSEEFNSIIIEDINYRISGSTRESVVRHYLNIDLGHEFFSVNDLEIYINEKTQQLLNRRTITEAEISYNIIEVVDQKAFISLLIEIKDSWNYILLPYPQFDSNTGLSLGLRGKNYNFLGGMETLDLSFDYLNLLDGGTEYTLGGGFKIPFYLWDFQWMYSFDNDLILSPESPVKDKTSMGLSLAIPFGGLDFLVSFNQDYFLNPSGADDIDGYYLITGGSVGSNIRIWEFNYSPAIITSYPYKFSGDLSKGRKGYKLGIKHSLTYGKIDWIGNIRNGFYATIYQDIQYNFTRELWVNSQNFNIQYHKYLGWGGFSIRVIGFYNINSAGENGLIGADIRGIKNDRLSGDSAIVVNTELPITFPLGFFNKWVNAQFSPFFDVAIVNSKAWFGSGFEGFGYLNASRSVYLRLSLGIDLEAAFRGDNIIEKSVSDGSDLWEFKAVVGHHY